MTTTATTQKTPSAQFLNRAKARRFHRIAKVMSGEIHGFGAKVERVVLDPSKACTDGKTIWLPTQMHDDDRYNTVMQEAVLAHECAHHRYTDFVAWNNNVVAKIKKGEADPLLHKMTNMLEDARINHLFGQDWRGSKKMMDFTHGVFMAQHKEQTTDESPAAQQAFVAMMSECIANEEHWFTTPKVVEFMDEVRPTLLNAIQQRDTMNVIRQARRLVKMFRAAFSEDPETPNNSDLGEGTSDDNLSNQDIERAAEAQEKQGRNPEEAGRDRFQDLQPPKPRPSQSQDESEDEADNESGDSTATGDEQSDEDSDDSSDSGSSDEVGDDSGEAGEGGDDGESGDADSDATESGSADGESDGDADSDGDSSDTDSQTGDSEIGAGKDALSGQDCVGEFEEEWADLLDSATDALDDDFSNAFDIEHDFNSDMDASTESVDETSEIDSQYGDHTIEVTAGVRDFHRRMDNLDSYATHYNNVARAGRGAIRSITKEITRRLKGSDPRYEGGARSGRLSSKQVWKFGHSDFDSSRVYQKKTDPADLVASAIVLIDASGSMGGGDGSPAAHAANAAVIYSEVFQSLGIDYEIIDFNSNYSGTTMRVRKAFGSSATRMERACIAMPSSGSVNADGYAVQWCLDRLNTRSGNRLLIAISDGSPSGQSPSGLSSSQHLRSVTDSADTHCPGVGLLGVGICNQDTSPYYPNAVSVTNLSTIGQETLPTLRKILKKMIPKKG
jgi:hypothetical protein